MDKGHLIQCLNCQVSIWVPVNQINCRIFRCGVYKADSQPIHPHLSKDECTRLVSENLIFGCGTAFYFDGTNLRLCEYI